MKVTPEEARAYMCAREVLNVAERKRYALPLNRETAQQKQEYWYLTGQIEAALEIMTKIRRGE